MDKIYLYPQTSCSLGYCKKEYPIPQPPFIKTNLAVENCEQSPYFDCYYRAELKQEQEPRQTPDGKDVSGYTKLNPQTYLNKLATDFNELPCATSKGCSNPNYISMDPRLFSAPRAEYLPLDTVPINGKVKLRDIYSDKYDGYGSGFTPYDKIRDGQIMYYIDDSIAGAFYKPVYSEPATETLSLYKDPMGAMKTVADRTPLINTANPTTTTPVSYPYCLSYIQDTQSFREDLIALQQRKHNQEKWTVRWT